MIKNFKNNLAKDKHFLELLKGSSIAFIFKIIGIGLGYIFMLLIARWYGADTMGLYALSLTVLNILTIFSVFGFDNALVKFVSIYKTNNKSFAIKEVLFKALSISIPLGIIFSIVLYFNAQLLAESIFHNTKLSIFFQIASFGIVPFVILKINGAVFIGLKKIKEFSFFDSILIFLFSIISLTLLYFFDYNNKFVMLSQIIGIFLASLISYLVLRKKLYNKKNSINIVTYKDIVSISFPMLLVSSMGLIMGWTDIIMLGIFKSEEEVGIYSVLVKLATLTNITLMAINTIVTPKFAEFYNKNDMENFKSIIYKSTKMSFYATLPIILIIIIFSKFILQMFGDIFISGTMALWILMFGRLINTISGSVANILKMTDNEKIIQYIVFIAMIINIILNYTLIPKYGLNGAAIATSFSLIFWNLLSVIYIKIKFNILTLYLPYYNKRDKK